MLKHPAVVLALAGHGDAAKPLTFFIGTHDEMLSLEQRDGKWVLLNLCATLCAPCLNEMPELEALSELRKDLVVVGLAWL